MAAFWRLPWWPMGPFVGAGVLLVLLAIAGFIFSLVMLVDCLKRPTSGFAHPLTKNGEYDKLIWAAAIVASFWLYFIGAIVYFFVVRRAESQGSGR
jgi:hypothetical protein